VSIREKLIVFIAVLEKCHKKSFDLFLAMPLAADLALFRKLVISGVLIGLIPLDKVKSSNLILTRRRFYRVWSPLIRIINIFVFPIMLVIRVLGVTKVSCDYSHFKHLVLKIFFAILSYGLPLTLPQEDSFPDPFDCTSN